MRVPGCVAACLAAVAAGAAAQFSPPRELVVVSDHNYPPYLFRDADGQLQGIVKDKWELWSARTGVAVKLEGMEWSKAQQSVGVTGKADVIDVFSPNETRARLYEFSPSWGKFESRVFFHRSISGISNARSMRGFTVGTKDASSCTLWLRQNGIESVRSYPDSEALVRAAGAGEVRLFCMDVPAAQYYLFKHGLADDFRQTATLNSADLVWAVAKGRTALRDFVQSGFGRISAGELQEIDERWMGNPVRLPIQPRYFYYAALLAAALLAMAALLALWNRMLSRRVAARTHALGERVKELAVLHAAARLFQKERSIDPQLLGELARLLPPGWQFPEICAARVSYAGIEARTAGWRETQWRQAARFETSDGGSGIVEVAYLEPRPADAEGPFLAEERNLIDSVAELIGAHFERIRIQSALHESQARLTLSVRSSSIGLWDWSLADNRVYFSPEWKGLLGYRDDEIEPRSGEWESRIHPDDKRHALARLQAFLRGSEVEYENEFRLRHKDGSYRWIYARGEVQRDADGTPQRLLGCHLDITARKRAEDELRQHAARLRALSHRLMSVEELERRNINRELHDRVGQNLSALQLSLATMRLELAGAAPPPVSARLDDAQTLLEVASNQVRDVMAELRPAALDDYGLLAAVRHHASAVAARAGFALEMEGEELEPRLPSATETALFRVVQEALNNIAKHARARKVKVRLIATPALISLSVTDDGAGFDAARRPPGGHYGLTTMNERAEAVGAYLHIESGPGKGTRVEISIARASEAAAA